MTVNERLERLERSAGQGDHDLLLKLDAMSRQIQHQETLIKQLEDANQERHRRQQLDLEFLSRLIQGLPSKFEGVVQLPIGSLDVRLYPQEPRVVRIGNPPTSESIRRGLDELFPNRPPSAVHEKPHP